MLIDELRRLCRRCGELESQARQALAAGDKARHRQCLVDRTTLLTELPERLAPHLASVAEPLRTFCRETLAAVAEDAARALAVDSVFYMAVLLMPDEDDAGGADILETLLHRLEAEG